MRFQIPLPNDIKTDVRLPSKSHEPVNYFSRMFIKEEAGLDYFSMSSLKLMA